MHLRSQCAYIVPLRRLARRRRSRRGCHLPEHKAEGRQSHRCPRHCTCHIVGSLQLWALAMKLLEEMNRAAHPERASDSIYDTNRQDVRRKIGPGEISYRRLRRVVASF